MIRIMTDSNCNDKWIGFDCGHAYDSQDIEAARKVFKIEVYSFSLGGSIKTKDYVEGECKSIIDQLKTKI